MPMITKPASISKNAAAEITLDKSVLADVDSVSNDLYFGDSTNWSEVLIYFRSSEGNQREILKFDATQASPTANFLVSDKARNEFQVQKIVIKDFDNDSFTVTRSELVVADFDVTLAGGGGTLENVVLTSFIGADTYTVNSNSVEKTAGSQSLDSTIVSSQLIQDNGYFEIGVTSSNPSSFWFIGLAKDPRNVGLNDWEFAVNRADFSYGIFESGSNVSVLNEAPQIGDIIKIAIESGVVKYYKNNVLFYTSSNSPSGSYYLQISLYSVGVSVDSLKVFGALS